MTNDVGHGLGAAPGKPTDDIKRSGNALSLAEIETFGAVLFEAATIWRIKHEAMRFIADKVAADGSILVFANMRPDQPRNVQHYTDAPCDIGDSENLSRQYFHLDPVFQALKAAMISSDYAVVSLDQVVDLPTFRRSPVYQHVYGQHGLSQVVTAIVAGLQGHVATLTFFRRSEERPFHEDDVALVRALLPLVGNAMSRIILRQRLFGLAEPQNETADFTWSSADAGSGFHSLVRPDDLKLDPVLPPVGQTAVLDEELGRIEEQMLKLSPRENEIAQLVSKGLTNIQIAELAGISYRTVELHVSSILRKLELNNRTELTYLICSIAGRRRSSEAGPMLSDAANWRIA